MEIPFPQRSVHLVAARLAQDPVQISRDALATCTLFAGLPEEAIAELAATARWQVFAPGEAVVREGDASIALYVVARGEAVVVHVGQEVARVGEGEVFGEMAFLSGRPRAATVRAATALAVVEVDSRALTALLAERRSLAEELAKRMASRLQELVIQEALAAVPVPPKGLATYLLERLLRLIGG